VFVVRIFCTSVKAVELQWIIIGHKGINIHIFLIKYLFVAKIYSEIFKEIFKFQFKSSSKYFQKIHSFLVKKCLHSVIYCLLVYYYEIYYIKILYKEGNKYNIFWFFRINLVNTFSMKKAIPLKLSFLLSHNCATLNPDTVPKIKTLLGNFSGDSRTSYYS
jgi:hypothetical protein